jgi:soluble lytic murein transglycosylase-like protein
MGSGENAKPYTTQVIIQQAWRFKMRPRLLASIAYVESRYTPGVLSVAGASGMLQVMPNLWYTSVVRECGRWLRGDVYGEVCAGAFVMRHYLDHHKDLRDALSAYNSGYKASLSTAGRRYLKDVTDYAGTVGSNF